MNPHFSRRGFLTASLASTALPLVAHAQSGLSPQRTPAVTPDTAGLTTYQLGPQIWIRHDNRLLTCYRAHPSQKYPYLYPLSGPLTGLPLTAETSLPYPHHRSLFFACDKVNGANYWQEDYDRGQIVSQGPRVEAESKTSVEIVDACAWQQPGGPVIMRDERRIVVTVPSPRLRFIDWTIGWHAVADVTVQKTNHALFAARAALDLTPAGGGHLRNAEGDAGEKGTFGKPSAWCDFSGPRHGLPGGIVEGIAIFDHPQNPWSPCPWFTRDYGFMSPTPMNWLEKPWALPAGQSITLRYRVVLHAGDAEDAGLKALHREWVA